MGGKPFSPEYNKMYSRLHGSTKDSIKIQGALEFFKREKERRLDLRERLDKVGIPRLGNVNSKRRLQYKYGLSIEEYTKLLEIQNGKCAICENNIKDELVVDHNHLTGKVRGLLCSRCNRFVGYVENFYLLIPKIKKYLGHI